MPVTVGIVSKFTHADVLKLFAAITYFYTDVTIFNKLCLRSTGADPRQWTVDNVQRWLKWAKKEFNLEGVDGGRLAIDGNQLVGLGEDDFLKRLPLYAGDILWQHLDILCKGELSASQIVM
jgi:hypothetical protein